MNKKYAQIYGIMLAALCCSGGGCKESREIEFAKIQMKGAPGICRHKPKSRKERKRKKRKMRENVK